MCQHCQCGHALVLVQCMVVNIYHPATSINYYRAIAHKIRRACCNITTR